MNEWRILDERGDVIEVDAARRDAWRSNPANRALARVGNDVIGEARVSTALRALADWHDLPWETVILGGPWNIWGRQYLCREHAERGHRDVWERLNLGLPPSPEDEPDTDL
jgi:hypothetical protein